MRLANAPCDPDFPEHRLITSEWMMRRHIGSARVARHARLVDVTDAATLQTFRTVLTDEATRLELADVDLSTITSAERVYTQACARYVFEQSYDGVRYVSRLGSSWECWAMFDTSAVLVERSSPAAIEHDDPDLMTTAQLFGFTIEEPDGRLLRPWMASV